MANVVVVIPSFKSKLEAFLYAREFYFLGANPRDYPGHFQAIQLVAPSPYAKKTKVEKHGFTDERRHELCYMSSQNNATRNDDGFFRISINIATVEVLWNMPIPTIVDKPTHPVGRIYRYDMFIAMLDIPVGSFIEMKSTQGYKILEVF